MEKQITFADLFAGGGGTSSGALRVPGVHVSWALNHDPIAIKTHKANHPETKHYTADIRTQNVKVLEKVNVLWASLECTEHSKAKGGKDKDIGSFTLGWEVHRYVEHCDPDAIMFENVPEFVRWGKLKKGKRVKGKEGLEYLRWIKSIKDLGYPNYQRQFLNAADYGCPTRRVRYFGIFTKPGIPIVWPKATHAKDENLYDLPKWKACKDYLDLENEGNSIFGREFNEDIPKGKRKPLVTNTLRRIAGGIRKFAPEVYMIMKYYGNSNQGNNFNCQSVNSPLHTIRTKDSHVLIKVEKNQFIQDYCFTDTHQALDEPLRTQLTRQTKQLITIDKKFLSKYYNGTRPDGREQHHCQDLDSPCPTITASGNVPAIISVQGQFIMDNYNRENVCSSCDKPATTITASGYKRLITTKAHFISQQNNSNGKPEANNKSIDDPLNSLTTDEKFQFITTYFTSGGKPESQNQSITGPLGSITAVRNKNALVTIFPGDIIDFDVKMRFLTADELGAIMGFDEGYFDHEDLKLSNKKKVEMIGNAVHTGMAEALIRSVAETMFPFSISKAS